MSRHGYQILSHRNCSNMAFLVATGVLVLCRDDVTTEVSLSRPRRSQREVRVVIRAWLGQEISGRNRKLLCHDRVFYVVIEFSQDQRVSCRDRIILGRNRVGQARSFLLRQNGFISRQSWQWWRGFVLR